MPQVIAVGLGTVFTVQGAKHTSSKNTDPMQTLAWLAKDNRPPESRKIGHVNHKHHPGKGRTLRTPQDAYIYAAEIFEAHWRKTLDALGLAKWPIALVPVPASCTTRESPQGERWPARAFAEQLETRGLGTVRGCVVNRKPTDAQTNSRVRIPAKKIAANLVQLGAPKRGEAVVFVDDVVTWGARMAAMNHVLAWEGPASAVCIAFTGTTDEVVDCYQAKKRSSPTTPPLVRGPSPSQSPTRRASDDGFMSGATGFDYAVRLGDGTQVSGRSDACESTTQRSRRTGGGI